MSYIFISARGKERVQARKILSHVYGGETLKLTAVWKFVC